MANAFSLEIKGLGSLQAHFQKMGKRIQEGIQDELEAAAFEIHDKAVRYITTNRAIDQGFLKNSMQITQDKQKRGWIVANTAVYAPFIEFGTIQRVQVPGEWAEYALQFKGLGIRKIGGIRPRPFMYPAYKEVTTDLPLKVERVVTRLLAP